MGTYVLQPSTRETTGTHHNTKAAPHTLLKKRLFTYPKSGKPLFDEITINTWGHDYIDHRYTGHDYAGPSRTGHHSAGRTDKRHNYIRTLCRRRWPKRRPAPPRPRRAHSRRRPRTHTRANWEKPLDDKTTRAHKTDAPINWQRPLTAKTTHRSPACMCACVSASAL